MTLPPFNQALAKSIGGWIVFIAVETLTQVVFKYAGDTLDASHGLVPLIQHALSTPIVIVGFVLYFMGFVLWLTILKDADLGRAFPMTAMMYLTTLTAAIFLFHEVLTPLRWLGIGAIVAGVLMLAADENSDDRATRVEGERLDAEVAATAEAGRV